MVAKIVHILHVAGAQNGYKLRKIHVLTENASAICGMGLIHAALNTTWNVQGLWNVLPYLYTITFLWNVSRLDYRYKFHCVDLIISINSLAFLLTCLQIENYYGVALLLSFSFGYFYVGDCGFFLDTEVPAIDIYQYIQCFLCYFTLKIFAGQNEIR